jgi:hypothetical protein
MLLVGPVTIFAYCERGNDPSFWAEPFNAVTNAGFVAAALAGMVLIARQRAPSRSAWPMFFIVNLIAIGIGSFLFHTVPNATTVAADTGPIGLFMVTYLIFAVRNFVRGSWLMTALAAAAFVALMAVAFSLRWLDARIGLNGSLGYVPAFIAMLGIGSWLAVKRRPSALWVLGAGGVFAISLTLRSIDRVVCGDLVVLDHRLGTHFAWHILNSVTLFLLLAAAIKYGARAQEVLPPKPRPSPSLHFGRP